MPHQNIQSYRDLIVWKRAMDLVERIYELTRMLPKEERYGLGAQMRRASISIPSNIAEGHYRGSKRDYVLFLRYAYGSGAELETQIIVLKRLYGDIVKDAGMAEGLLEEVMKMLNRLISNLSR